MPLTLTLKAPSSIPLEVDSVRLEVVRAQSTDDVARTRIQRGNRQPELGEFFDVRGSAGEDGTIVWQGDCSRVKSIGASLAEGTIRVEGNAGMHLGARMTGGEILCANDAGDWVGAEMRGGRITVYGNAGDLVGAVYRGGRRGMRGGEILIHGSAGHEIGHTLRRGLIAIGGGAGDAAGMNMIAGSIFIGGKAGRRYGSGMKRGTIGLLGGAPQESLIASFPYSCTYRPAFLQLYLRHLVWLGFPLPEECLDADYRRYCGDVLSLAKGEILVRNRRK